MTDDGFVREARDSVRTLSGGLVELERAGADGDVDDLFRTAHGLKGLLAMEGYDTAADGAHALEDFLGAIRRGEIEADAELTDHALAVTDRLADAVGAVARDGDVGDASDVAAAATGLRSAVEDAGGRIERDDAADGAASTTADAGDRGRAVSESSSSGRPSGTDAASDSVPTPTPDPDPDSDPDPDPDSDSDPSSTDPDAGGLGDPADLEAAGVVINDDVVDDPFDEELPSAEAALASADEYDDLDALVEDLDGAEEFADLEGGGSFADVDVAVEAGADADADADADGSSGSTTGLPEEPDDPQATFAALREEVGESDVDELQSELADVEFGEFDDEDDLTIDELLTAESTDTGDAGDLSEWVVDDGATDAPTTGSGDGPGPASQSSTPDSERSSASPSVSASTSRMPADSDASSDPTASSQSVTAGSDDGFAGTGFETAVSDVESPADGHPPADGDPVTSTPTAGTDDDTAAAADANSAANADDDRALAEVLDALTADDGPAAADTTATTTETAAGGDATTTETQPTTGGADAADEVTDADPASRGVTGSSGSTDESAAGPDAPSAPDDGATPAPDLDDVDPRELGDRAAPNPDAGALDAATDAANAGEAGGTDGDELDDLVADAAGVGTSAASGVAPDSSEPTFERDAETAAFEDRFGDVLQGRDADVELGTDVTERMRAATTVRDSSYRGPLPEADAAAGLEPEAEFNARNGDLGQLRVDPDVAAEMLQFVEDLDVARLQFREELASLDVDLSPTAIDQLETIAGRTGDLRRSVMDVRLMAVSAVTDRLPRVARDAARTEDKDVQVTVDGDDVKLDRDVVDRIGEPLTHLVRNAVSHGIEPPDERAAAGKPATGTVTVRVRRSGREATIEVSDDGRGVDVDDVRRAAVERGVVTREEAAGLDRRETLGLLFEPGFSTAASVTTVSGRGVGLDAVREVVSALDGTVELKSTPGEGTTVRLEFPVTVAMAELLFVDAGAETFALPAAAVEGVHRLGDADPPSRAAVTDGGAGVTTVDGRSETTIDLREAMGAPPTSDADVSPLERAAVRIERNGEPMVLACDRVRDKREAVVDPFDDLLAGVSGVSGTTVSSDGRIVTVIDIDTL